MLLAMFLFACMDAVNKYLAASYAIVQIVWVRYLFFVAFAILLVRPRRIALPVRTVGFWLQVVRSLLLIAEIGTFVWAFRYLPLADVHALAAITPLLVTALSVVMLGERVGWRRWCAVASGFIGVLVIVRPGFAEIDWRILIPLLGALLFAIYQILLRIVARYDLAALPVVDADGRMLGVVTADDVIDILVEEGTEDVLRFGGVERGMPDETYFTVPILQAVRRRVPWLLLLFVGGSFTANVLGFFEDELASMVALTFYVPLLIGTGGNTGNQAATTVTRALALGDVRLRDLPRVIAREFRVGLSLGLILGSLAFVVTSLLYGASIGTVIGLTFLSVCTMAATVGGAMPMLARAVRADPAVFSNPFISTFVDATGLLIYFLIARAVLGI